MEGYENSIPLIIICVLLTVGFVLKILMPYIADRKNGNGNCRNRDNPGIHSNPGYSGPRCEAEIRHCIERSEERQALRDASMFEKMDKELEVLQSIDKKQAVMCERLLRLNGGQGGGQ